MAHFKQMPMQPNQVLLFATSVDSAIPAESDVRIMSEIMDMLDWSDMESGYSDKGCPAYPPRVLTKLLAYAYYNGVRSSRKIESLVENDKRYIWLAGGLAPDFRTLARFRRAKWAELVSLFDDTARLCATAGLVFLNLVSIDGSKVCGAASARSVYNAKRIERERKCIEKVLEEAEEVDRAEDEQYGSSNGRELPAKLANAQKRKEVLEKAAKLLEESKRERVVVTDPESRLMNTRSGPKSSYNVQAAVDAESQVILAMDVVDSETDHGLLMPMIEKVEQNMGVSADTFLADSGYCDEETLLQLQSGDRDALMPPLGCPNERRESLFRSESFEYDAERDMLICPAGRELCFKRIHKKKHGTYKVYAAKGCGSCSFHHQCAGGKSSRTVERSVAYHMRAQMRERLRGSPGKEQYKQRGESIEPVFGQVKSNRGLGRLLLRGIQGAKAEFALAFIGHNVSKCAKLLSKRAIAELCDAHKAVLTYVCVSICCLKATLNGLQRRRLPQHRIASVIA